MQRSKIFEEPAPKFIRDTLNVDDIVIRKSKPEKTGGCSEVKIMTMPKAATLGVSHRSAQKLRKSSRPSEYNDENYIDVQQ